MTPPLSDSILAGVTRDSVITLAKEHSLVVEERPLSVKELRAAHTEGTLKEVFGTGTAAVISPVGELSFAGESVLIHDGKPGPVATTPYEHISGIQRGTKPDPHGWMVPIA